MVSFSNFSTRTKLYFGFGLIIIAIIAINFQSYQSVSKIHASEGEMVNLLSISRNLTQLRSDENRLNGLIFEIMVTKDQNARSLTIGELKDGITLAETKTSEINKSLENFPSELKIFQDVTTTMVIYRRNRQLQLDLIASGKTEQAIDLALREQDALYVKIRSKILDIENSLDQLINTIELRDEAEVHDILVNLVISGSVVVFICLLLILWLRGMLSRIFKEIGDGVNILGTSASEILTTVTEVSTGATETSTAVSETTVTIEEIRQTALLATQKAQSVLESSHRASEAAENGRDAVQHTIEGMARIKDQMKMISESVGKLAEQSRSIGEITATVNDIADQSNLLAVNAAIEAARAGEQGRGFTVVAQEIRSLAEQSKKATAQVKEILNEIQKGMNLTVMATEQGTKAVDNGNSLAVQSGEMIDVLSDTVGDTAQSVIQISASSQQQMAGMDQIVPAMENIKQASEQNVAGVRQTQTAAHNLNDLGRNLKEIIEKYKF
jgi:methyl-accepting chemotaxis protein